MVKNLLLGAARSITCVIADIQAISAGYNRTASPAGAARLTLSEAGALC
jgi:hypothetical protein